MDKNKQLCEDEGVKGYPALKYYLPGEPEGIDYSGGRDLESLKAFAKTLGPSCSPKYYSKVSCWLPRPLLIPFDMILQSLTPYPAACGCTPRSARRSRRRN